MDGSYLELLKKKERLQSTIDLARRREVCGVLQEIVHRMTTYGISLDDIAMALYAGRDSGRKGRRRAPKYLDPESGKTWAGVGRTPTWLQGKNLDDYRLPTGGD
ncbi:TPA: H-NS family nucleoid-associated regulatory protein [Burkholderia cenocepacia]|nr:MULTISPECIES: H-NS histone family protein [Burkholderia]MBJ9923948.1 H-NS histone family protein [Burkholderia cenocepacia]UJH78746.1 H-NS histone family protein [Burkholderia cenocepacia]